MNRRETFQDFWPRYLADHSHPANRALHYVGSLAAFAALLLAAIIGDWRIALAAPLLGYGPAWVGHFFIERNRPATFRHPLWSLRGDLRMVMLWCRGDIGAELARHEITP